SSQVGQLSVHRQDDHLDSGIEALQTGQRIEAAHVGHGDVGDDDVGAKAGRGLDQIPPVLDDSDQFEFRLEQHPQALGDDAVIVGEQDAWETHVPSSARGTQATTVVPWPGALSMSSSPPARWILSFKLTCPRLRRARAATGSKPMPSSRIAS